MWRGTVTDIVPMMGWRISQYWNSSVTCSGRKREVMSATNPEELVSQDYEITFNSMNPIELI
jgi:hypothetical protein